MYIQTDITIRLLLLGLGLYRIAQVQPTEIKMMSDSATLARKNCSHTTAGIGGSDLSAVNPDSPTGEQLFAEYDTDENARYKNANSLKNIKIC